MMNSLEQGGFRWKEPTATMGPGSMNFTADSGCIVMPIQVAWTDLAAMVKYVLGFSQVWPVTDFNNIGTSPVSPSTFKLQRFPPARHPRWPNFRCTKILSVQGQGLSAEDRTNKGLPIRSIKARSSGTYGDYDIALVHLQFEVPRYPIMDDAELAGRSECARYCEFTLDTNIETLARKGAYWKFLSAIANGQQASFNGDRLLKQPKGVLKWSWRNVHEDFVLLGKLIPTNYLKRIATVNSLPFPPYARRDQNAGGSTLVALPPGTLLMLPPKITHCSQMHPAVLSGQVPGDLFPRCVDVEGSAVYFDPPTDEPATVNLTAVDGSATQVIQGHNLAPLVMPSTTGYIYYAAYMAGQAGAPTPFTTHNQLLYQYANWDKLFTPVESL